MQCSTVSAVQYINIDQVSFVSEKNGKKKVQCILSKDFRNRFSVWYW